MNTKPNWKAIALKAIKNAADSWQENARLRKRERVLDRASDKLIAARLREEK